MTGHFRHMASTHACRVFGCRSANRAVARQGYKHTGLQKGIPVLFEIKSCFVLFFFEVRDLGFEVRLQGFASVCISSGEAHLIYRYHLSRDVLDGSPGT